MDFTSGAGEGTSALPGGIEKPGFARGGLIAGRQRKKPGFGLADFDTEPFGKQADLHFSIVILWGANDLAIGVNDEPFGRDNMQGSAATLTDSRVVRWRSPDREAGNHPHGLPSGQLPGVDVVEESIIQDGVGGQRKITFPPAEQQTKHQRGCQDRWFSIPPELKLGYGQVIADCPVGPNCVSHEPAAVNRLRLQRHAGAQPQPDALYEELFVTDRTANDADVDIVSPIVVEFRGTELSTNRVGVVVGRTDRDDSQRRIAVRREESVGDFMNGSVSAGGRDHTKSLCRCSAGQLTGVTRRGGRANLDRTPERVLILGEAAIRCVATRVRIEDYANRHARCQGNDAANRQVAESVARLHAAVRNRPRESSPDPQSNTAKIVALVASNIPTNCTSDSGKPVAYQIHGGHVRPVGEPGSDTVQ